MMAKLLLILIALSSCYCSAQVVQPPSPPTHTNPPAAAPTAAAQEYLDAHNQARAEVGVAPLKWSQQLAKTASLQVRYQRDRQNCTFANLTNSIYGGNQLWASGLAVTPRVAVETWVAEKKFYTYADNSCSPDHRCGVYTQVVWKQSVEVGCAQAACSKEHASLTICLYNPPGNVIGEKPY